jgi:hypothetical protein
MPVNQTNCSIGIVFDAQICLIIKFFLICKTLDVISPKKTNQSFYPSDRLKKLKMVAFKSSFFSYFILFKILEKGKIIRNTV